MKLCHGMIFSPWKKVKQFYQVKKLHVIYIYVHIVEAFIDFFSGYIHVNHKLSDIFKGKQTGN